MRSMRFLALVALLCAAAVPSAVAAPDPLPPPRPPIDPRLLIIGDSVSLGAQPWIAALLSARGWHVYQTSRESMHTWEAGAIVDANRAHGGVGDVVVVQLGTNDGVDPGLLGQWMDELLTRLDDVDRVYWINLRQFRSWVPAANATIAAATQRHPNLRIIDWDARATPDPSLVYSDGYHLNPGGQLVMAQLIMDTLDGFVRETAVPSTTLPLPTTTAPVATSSNRASTSSDDEVDTETMLVLIGAAALLVVALLATRVRPRRDPSV